MNTDQEYGSSSEIDIVVHVAEKLDEQNRRRVEYAMLMAAGIGHARFDSFRQHLLIVGYNPALTDSAQILGLVRQQELHAQLVVGL